MAERPPKDWLRPGIILPVFAALLVATVVLTPFTSLTGREGDPRLTIRSTSSQGARGLSDVARRLGWAVAARETSFASPLDTTAVYAVLGPPIDLTSMEARVVLDAVRRGAGLLYVIVPGAVLSDSLSLRRSAFGGGTMEIPDEGGAFDSEEQCEGVSDGGVISWPGDKVAMYSIVPSGPLAMGSDTTFIAVRRGKAPPDSAGDTIRFDGGRKDAVGRFPAALGFRYGQGRIVAIADPDLLRNDVLRTCRWNAGVTAVRMLEWLDPAGARRLVFDEFHQGYGRHPSASRAVGRLLAETPFGRMLAHLLVALGIFMLAVGARALSPRSRARFERRSPLEHVGALSRAYEQVGATRLATRRLLRGVRRRYTAGARAAAGRRESDEEFLRAIGSRFPELAADIALTRQALAEPFPPARFLEVGRAIDHIERTLHQT